MDRRHARYPFFESAREAVQAADVEIGALVGGADDAAEADEMVVSRARDRVESALSEGHVGTGGETDAETGMHRSTRIELLSYPIARILVSLLEEPMAIEAYARAEAATARQRLQADLPEPGGSDGQRGGLGADTPEFDVDELLAEFGLAEAVEGRDPFAVDVAVYLELSRDLDGDGWALVNRSLSAGRVPVDRAELYDLLERAVADRVTDGLPLSVPEQIASEIDEPLETIEGMLADAEIPLSFDRVEPPQFPPCVTALLERAREGESLPAHSQYSLVGFLGAAGMDAGTIVELADGELDRESVDFQLAHVRDDEGLEYAPPSCASMDVYGDCVNRDDRCDTINHPLSYYESALADAGEE